jgi:hypothetical protein
MDDRIHYDERRFISFDSQTIEIMPRTYDEELKFIERINGNCWRIKKGFVPNMNVRTSWKYRCRYDMKKENII